MNSKSFGLIIALCLPITVWGQRKLTLNECRGMALQDNTQQRIDQENAEAAKYVRQGAFARFFPQFSANGAYMYNTENAHLIPKTLDLGSLGTISGSGLGNWEPITTIGQGINEGIGSIYQDLYRRLTLDFQHVFVAQVGVVQPIYVGGKLIQFYRLTKYAEQLQKVKAGKNRGDLIVGVEEAYWRVISVNEKRKLAEQYYNLLNTLLTDVESAVAEGVATKADVLKVRVKLNEAETSRSKATDGLKLSKMALCQLIGLPLEEDIVLDDSGLDNVVLENDSVDIDQAVARREEMQMLEAAHKMARVGVHLAGSMLQPNIIASANYIATNPNLIDGFKNDMRGFFSVGVVVNVPIAHAGDILNYKAAKHKAKTIELKMQEAREKIELQATQSKHKVVEANLDLIRANNNIKHADENLRYAKEGYEEGVITATELMAAQTAWMSARSQKIDAAIALRMAELTYKQHTGQLQ